MVLLLRAARTLAAAAVVAAAGILVAATARTLALDWNWPVPAVTGTWKSWQTRSSRNEEAILDSLVVALCRWLWLHSPGFWMEFLLAAARLPEPPT